MLLFLAFFELAVLAVGVAAIVQQTSSCPGGSWVGIGDGGVVCVDESEGVLSFELFVAAGAVTFVLGTWVLAYGGEPRVGRRGLIAVGVGLGGVLLLALARGFDVAFVVIAALTLLFGASACVAIVGLWLVRTLRARLSSPSR